MAADSHNTRPTGADVRALRRRHGLSLAQLAARCPRIQISPRTIERWEQDRGKISLGAWRYMLAQLGEIRLPEKGDGNA